MLRTFVIALQVVVGASPCAHAQKANVREAIDVIVMFCVAGGEKVELTGSLGGAGLELKTTGGQAGSDIRISKSDARGLVDGIRREMNNVAAGQASEARKCMQPYIERIVDLLLGAPAPKAPTVSYGEIFIEWPPSNSPCTVNYRIDLADQTIIPQGPLYRVPNIRLGPASWTIRGGVRCSDGTFCESIGPLQSGQADLQFGRTYRFFWNVAPGTQGGECMFSLQG
ncbi:hypothetical protein [Bradyrhizobium yuanmingense]|nr:hypothetical protein [Bradyrhizobium yuanmingense]